MMRPTPKLLLGSGRNLGDSLPAPDGALTRRPCRGRVREPVPGRAAARHPGGTEPVLPTVLPCELHSSPDWAWRSPGKQNGDPPHSCSDVEFTIATRPRPRRTNQEVTNHECSLPPRPPKRSRLPFPPRIAFTASSRR